MDALVSPLSDATAVPGRLVPPPLPPNPPRFATHPSLAHRPATPRATSQSLPINPHDLNKHRDIPTVDQTIVHLRLLHAFHALRTEVESSDGIYGLYEANAVRHTFRDNGLLEQLREKRWQVFVTHAVDRFCRWWDAAKIYVQGRPVTLQDMTPKGLFQRQIYLEENSTYIWTPSFLPPLDILMVWHCLALSPHAYLEDCLRHGMIRLWVSGFPWAAVNSCFTESGNYAPPSDTIDTFVEYINMAWSPRGEAHKRLKCPNCWRFEGRTETLDIPWTTAGNELASGQSRESLQFGPISWLEMCLQGAHGFADKYFRAICPRCTCCIDHEFLKADRLMNDVKSLSHKTLLDGIPLAGTLLDMEDGVPRNAKSASFEKDPKTFPNRLFAAILAQQSQQPYWVSLSAVQSAISEALINKDLLRHAHTSKKSAVDQSERTALRNCLARYSETAIPFGVDLVASLVRQGSFVERMVKIDWLHSPTLRPTTAKLLTKYSQFFTIWSSEPSLLMVPTLDVDLSWHTHMLMPKKYYSYCQDRMLGKFINHDDKIPEHRLADAFAETSRLYQWLYGEPYALCTCWYCEAVRASHTTSISRWLHRAKAIKPSVRLHDRLDPLAAPLDPDRCAHISSHNAARPVYINPQGYNKLRRQKHKELESGFAKASRRHKADNISTNGMLSPVDNKDRASVSIGSQSDSDHGEMPQHPYMAHPFSPSVYVSNPSTMVCLPEPAGWCAVEACGGKSTADACSCSGSLLGQTSSNSTIRPSTARSPTARPSTGRPQTAKSTVANGTMYRP